MQDNPSPSGFDLMADPETEGVTEHPYPPLPNEFEIQGDQGGELHGGNGRAGVSIFADGETKMFKRNAIKGACTPQARKVQWLVAELDGVRAYVKTEGGCAHVVLTRQDLYP